MKIKELAYALNLSEQMTYRCISRGMPRHSIEEAEKWRRKHLDPSKTKEARAGGNSGLRAGRGQSELLPSDEELLRGDKFYRQLEHWLFLEFPKQLCDPLAIAAVASDAGLKLNGREVLRFTQHLFAYYHRVVGIPPLVTKVEIPDMLCFRPDEWQFDRVSGIIENVVGLLLNGDPAKKDAAAAVGDAVPQESAG